MEITIRLAGHGVWHGMVVVLRTILVAVLVTGVLLLTAVEAAGPDAQFDTVPERLMQPNV